MKEFLLVLLAVIATIALGACGDGMSNTKCRQAVVEQFATSDVQQLPELPYAFIVRSRDGSVWYVETRGARKAEVTHATQLFGSSK